MQTKDTDFLSDPTLAKLLEVDSDLAAQEASLTTQLQEIQNKRSSLKTVIGLFMPGETLTPATQAQAALLGVQAPAEEILPLADPTATPSLNSGGGTQEQGIQLPRTRRPRATARRTRGTTRASAPSFGRKTESWRPYVREEFAAFASLPEIVTTVLQRQPEHVFEVPEIMNVIFVEDISKDAYKLARGRLLSVLSQGVKQNKWQRGEKGQYSSASAVPGR